ncbi:glycosyltransferase-like domain-containing protein 1 [Balamuthia mandrillaris]
MLNLAELIALRQDLASLRKIVYFHENQLEYPCREEKERDVQFGYAQMLTCMVADVVCWNSRYNMTSFLHGLHGKLLRLMPPDQRLDSVAEAIRQKSVVLYYPIVLSLPAPLLSCTTVEKEEGPLHIVWNHRWEWDKGPDQFFKSIFALQQEGLAFHVSVLGEQFGEVPEVFEEARKRLEPHIRHWGFLSSKDAYYKALREADVVVSTALHEFFGVSVVEAIEQGCWPICPNRLVFPEYLPSDHLYNTETQLVKKLRYFARYPGKLRHVKKEKHGGGPVVDLSPFSWNNSLRHRYKALLTLRDE